jgi:hypothetical protein
MKPINFQFSIFLICLNLIFLLQSNESMAQTYQIATYNIRFDNPKDLSDLWINRSPHLINQIIFHKMDRRRPTLPGMTPVPSALQGLTSLFGMGRGGTPAPGRLCLEARSRIREVRSQSGIPCFHSYLSVKDKIS